MMEPDDGTDEIVIMSPKSITKIKEDKLYSNGKKKSLRKKVTGFLIGSDFYDLIFWKKAGSFFKSLGPVVPLLSFCTWFLSVSSIFKYMGVGLVCYFLLTCIIKFISNKLRKLDKVINKFQCLFKDPVIKTLSLALILFNLGVFWTTFLFRTWPIPLIDVVALGIKVKPDIFSVFVFSFIVFLLKLFQKYHDYGVKAIVVEYIFLYDRLSNPSNDLDVLNKKKEIEGKLIRYPSFINNIRGGVEFVFVFHNSFFITTALAAVSLSPALIFQRAMILLFAFFSAYIAIRSTQASGKGKSSYFPNKIAGYMGRTWSSGLLQLSIFYKKESDIDSESADEYLEGRTLLQEKELRVELNNDYPILNFVCCKLDGVHNFVYTKYTSILSTHSLFSSVADNAEYIGSSRYSIDRVVAGENNNSGSRLPAISGATHNWGTGNKLGSK